MQYLLNVQHFHPTRPLALYNNLLTWRTSFFARGDEYPPTLVSGLPTTAPPFAPLTLSHPTVQITLFTKTTSTILVNLIWDKVVLGRGNCWEKTNGPKSGEGVLYIKNIWWDLGIILSYSNTFTCHHLWLQGLVSSSIIRVCRYRIKYCFIVPQL